MTILLLPLPILLYRCMYVEVYVEDVWLLFVVRGVYCSWSNWRALALIASCGRNGDCRLLVLASPLSQGSTAHSWACLESSAAFSAIREFLRLSHYMLLAVVLDASVSSFPCPSYTLHSHSSLPFSTHRSSSNWYHGWLVTGQLLQYEWWAASQSTLYHATILSVHYLSPLP